MRILFSILIILISNLHSYTQTAEEVVEIYLKAIGGKTNLNRIENLKISGATTNNGVEIPIIIEQKGNTKYQLRTEYGGSKIIPGSFDGKTAWFTNILNGKYEILEDESAEAIIKEAREFPNPLLNYKNNGYSIALGNDQIIGEKECYQLILTRPVALTEKKELKERTIFYIAKETGLVIKKMESGMLGQLTTLLSDYRKINGVYFPFRIETEVNGNIVSALLISEIQANIRMDDQQFAMPNQ